MRRMRSFEAIAMKAPQKIDMTAKTMTGTAADFAASGAMGRHRAIMP